MRNAVRLRLGPLSDSISIPPHFCTRRLCFKHCKLSIIKSKNSKILNQEANESINNKDSSLALRSRPMHCAYANSPRGNRSTSPFFFLLLRTTRQGDERGRSLHRIFIIIPIIFPLPRLGRKTSLTSFKHLQSLQSPVHASADRGRKSWNK